MVHKISKYIIALIHLTKLTSKVLSAYVGGSWIVDSDFGNRLVFLIKLTLLIKYLKNIASNHRWKLTNQRAQHLNLKS